MTNENTAGRLYLSLITFPSLCALTKQGLWEEYLAKVTGKEVNQEAVIGGSVCRIDEAEEPSDVLWENIDASIVQRYSVLCAHRCALCDFRARLRAWPIRQVYSCFHVFVILSSHFFWALVFFTFRTHQPGSYRRKAAQEMHL